MRVLIVGLGGVGAMAAWRLSKAGHQVVGLEQFGVDHDRGSSFGDSRIVRRVYPDDLYTAMMADSYALWDALMTDSGQPDLFVPSGGIFFGAGGDPQVTAAAHALSVNGVEHELLDAAACARRFPAVRLEQDEVALFEPRMGYARASNCVRAALDLARRRGAEIHEQTSVSRVLPSGVGVRVETLAGAIFEADRLILCAGPWTNRLLAPLSMQLPLSVTRQPYLHLRPTENPQLFLPGAFPVWIDVRANAYGFPQLGDLPGVKIGIHHRGAESDPDSVPRALTEKDREAATTFARRRFPWLGSDIVYEKVCLYTNTPDEDFVIDSPPGLPSATVFSSCSGHGFKFTPLMGQIAAEIVDGQCSRNLGRFRASRFAASQNRD